MKFKQLLLINLSLIVFGLNAQNLRKDSAYAVQGYEMVEQQMGFYHDSELESYVNKLGQRLVSQLDPALFEYEFYLVDSPEPNAFAIPGGKVFITRGLLALPKTEDELAGVIGHEIIHSNNRHGVKAQTGNVFGKIIAIPGVIIGGIFRGPIGSAIASPFLIGNELLQADYSRGNEKEADKLGTEIAAKAGYDPMELAYILKRLSLESQILTGEAEQKSYFASHPYTPKRVEAITKHSQTYKQADTPPIADKNEFLKPFDDLMIGFNPKYGYIEKGKLYNPEYKYSFKLGEEWQGMGSPAGYGIVHSKQEAMITLMVEKDSLSYSDYSSEFEQLMLEQTKMRPSDKSSVDWDGKKGKMLEYTAEQNGTKLHFQLYTIQYDSEHLFKVATLCSTPYVEDIEGVIKSAKWVKKGQFPSTKVPTLKIVEANKGVTLQELIDAKGDEEFVKFVLMLNENSLSHQYKGGELVKLVVNKSYNQN
ncbi:MAG: M48 family metalloprotease [Schleiferiaceae bacterium]|jgi:predicted Zn-dependent protease|nr:M48 family metalloprotease [Schleiferiaceae bacterium]